MRKKQIAGYYLVMFFLIVVIALAGCGSGGGPTGGSSNNEEEPLPGNDGTNTVNEEELPPDEYEAVLFDTTKTVGDGALAKLIEVKEDGTYRFSGTPDDLKDITAKNVIVGGVSEKTPYGLLRLVTGVETDSGDLVLHTVPAPIQLAFKKLHVKITRSVPDIGSAVTAPKAVRLQKQVKAGKIKGGIWPPPLTINYFAFNGDNDPATNDDQVHVTGTLSGGLDYTFGIDVDWGEVGDIPDKVTDCVTSLFISCSIEDFIPEAIVDFKMSSQLKADIAQKGVSFLSYAKDIPVYGPVYFPPIQIGLVTLLPEFEISSRIEGEASSEFETNVTMTADAGTGVVFSNKSLVPQLIPPVATVDISSPTVDATLDAYSKVRLGPQFSLKLYGFAGPRAGMFGYVELKADQDNITESKPCFNLNGGVEGELSFVIGVDFPILGPVTIADWNLDESIWTEEIKSGDCTGGSNVQENPLQNPTFTPWARAYNNTVVTTGLPYSAPGGGFGWADFQRTIDGNFVIAGSGSKGLLKIDNDGLRIWSKRFIGPTLGDPFIDELLPDRVTNTGDAAMFVAAYPWALLKVDASGELMWAKQFPFKPNDDWWRLSDIEADGSGGFYLTAGYGTDDYYELDFDSLVARLDADANILWLRRIGDSMKGEIPRIIIPFDGGIVVAGSKCDILPNTLCDNLRLWAVHVDSNGTILWKKEYPVTECATAYETSVHPLAGYEAEDGDIIIGGTIDSSPERSFFAKIKPDGTLSFLTSYKASYVLNLADLSLTSLAPLPTSGYIATGIYLPYIAYPDNVAGDLWIASMDGIGQIQWIKRIKSSGTSEELLPVIQYTDDGGALVTGYTEEIAGGEEGYCSVKVFAKDGQISFTATSGVSVEDIDVTVENSIGDSTMNSTFCPTTADWAPAVQDMTVSLTPVSVTVEDLAVTESQLAP